MINEDDLQKSPKPSLVKQSGEKIPITDQFQAVESATSSVENLYKEGTLDPVYHAKTVVLNRALQEIGMGKYQVCVDYQCLVTTDPSLMMSGDQYTLLMVAGMGWFA